MSIDSLTKIDDLFRQIKNLKQEQKKIRRKNLDLLTKLNDHLATTSRNPLIPFKTRASTLFNQNQYTATPRIYHNLENDMFYKEVVSFTMTVNLMTINANDTKSSTQVWYDTFTSLTGTDPPRWPLTGDSFTKEDIIQLIRMGIRVTVPGTGASPTDPASDFTVSISQGGKSIVDNIRGFGDKQVIYELEENPASYIPLGATVYYTGVNNDAEQLRIGDRFEYRLYKKMNKQEVKKYLEMTF